jgi:hypothetical protein
MAEIRVGQQTTKRFLRGPFLRYGQCYCLWPYFFQLGGILAGKHSAHLDAFGTAFLGARGESGAVERFLVKVADHLLAHSVTDEMTFQDYIGTAFRRRVGYTGDTPSFLLEHGMDKMQPATAVVQAWEYAVNGASLGAIYPQIVQEMFERTHVVNASKDWDWARAAGLDIPPEQDIMTYDEVEQGEDQAFMAYCGECCPSLYSILSG